MPPKNVIQVGQKTKNIFKLYEPMLIALLIFGYNFDFYYDNRLIRTIAKMYCITLVTIVSIATMTCCMIQGISQIWSLIEYSSSVLIILFFKSRMRDFLKNLSDVDIYLRIRRKHYFWDKYKMFIITIVVWVARCYYTYLYCDYYICYNDFSLYFVSLLSPFALDLSRVWRCILFDTIRYRLTMLRMRLEENPEDNFYLYVKDNKSLKEDKIKLLLSLYQRIADLVELVSPELHASVFVSVACNLPKLVINAYYILTVLEGHAPLESISFVIIHIVQICGLLFSPFVIVEYYSAEVERIQLFLINKLVEDDDPNVKEQVDLFLRYITIRSFQYKMWRIIPINVSVPLELINLCTTYVIVIINFTHLYDKKIE